MDKNTTNWWSKIDHKDFPVYVKYFGKIRRVKRWYIKSEKNSTPYFCVFKDTNKAADITEVEPATRKDYNKYQLSIMSPI